MRLSKAKREARNSRRKDVRPAEEFGIENLNPRGSISKGLEMGAKRAFSLHLALSEMLEIQGTVDAVKADPIIGVPRIEKRLREALGREYWRHPLWRYGWEWLVDHWISGGLERSIEVTMMNMPSQARARVSKHVGNMNQRKGG